MKILGSIYFDHNASTPMDGSVLAKMMPYYTESFGNAHSSEHVLGWRASNAVELSATKIARMIGSDPDELFFTSGATESNNIAILGVARGNWKSKRKIITTRIEHKSIINTTRQLANEGLEISYVPVDGQGRINLEHLQDLMDDSVALISFSAVNSEIGTIQEIKQIFDMARAKGVLVHWDAAQAPLTEAIYNLSEFADLISLSAHKMYGPQGIGALFVRREIQERLQPITYGGGQQTGIRPGTVPVALCVGMAHAAELLTDQTIQSEERRRIGFLRDRFVEGVTGLGYEVRCNGPQGENRHPGNANLQFCGFSGVDIIAMLQPELAASTGSACTSGMSEPSHVLRGIGLSDAQAAASVRFCIGRFTTLSDIDEGIALVARAMERALAIEA